MRGRSTAPHDLLHLRNAPASHAVEVDAARHLTSRLVAPIPADSVQPCPPDLVAQETHALAGRVEDRDLDRGLLKRLELDLGPGRKRVRIGTGSLEAVRR